MTPDFELGSWLGRRQAMATCAARATASDVACLRYIRDHKLYKAHTSTWADFCSNYIGASKTQIDLDIRNAEEFGDQFFILNQLTRVSPAAYRAISPNITREGIVFRGEIIPFTESRITEISQAVDTLHRELPTAPKPRLNVSRALQILQSAVSQLEIHYATLTPAQRFVVSAVARRLSPIGHAPAGLGRPPDASPYTSS
jgi:hypothetical protein